MSASRKPVRPVWPAGTARTGLLLAIVAAAAIPAAHAAQAQTYSLDPVHTRVLFAISHAGFSQAMGTVSGSTGTLVFDREDWRSAKLDVRVPLERLDMGDAKWNDAVRAANLLDTKRHPEAHFVSTSVEPSDADHAKVCGDLTLRGVTKPVCLDVTLNALKRHPLPPFHRTAGFSATTTLNRADFGMNAWKNVIGDTVELRIEAEAERARNGAQDESPSPQPEAMPSQDVPEPSTDPTTEPEPTP
ncbi:YceI family protein [Lysobacter sp. MMG2]|uniref:YceI family protein n=1 Tax=Lysobacter sp. MMG2 TaxID=2801338 RepID=UPI001C250BA6|nr:YceI family protein [Lysobacter sp. MMG2]MBU8976612.1 YceI family protein [Lysobacter sp. MMG2]